MTKRKLRYFCCRSLHKPLVFSNDKLFKIVWSKPILIWEEVKLGILKEVKSIVFP